MMTRGRIPALALAPALAAGLVSATPSSATGLAPGAAPPGYTLYGTTGLIDMPSAQSAPDGELAFTVGHFAGSTRNTLTFQITPRLSGSFRYSKIENFFIGSGEEIFDRSFDMEFRLLDEGQYRPAVAVGLRDFLGTGLYSSEYIVATKQVFDRIKVTGGIGWGRLGSYNGFANPLGVIDERFETRPVVNFGLGGTPRSTAWFRGPAALFGGVEWQATDRLALVAEYSSDAYDLETTAGRDLFERRSPLNFGARYRWSDMVTLSGYYLYGSEVGVQATLALNPKNPPSKGSLGPAPLPVAVRAPGPRDTSWTAQPDGRAILQENLQTLLTQEGLVLEAMELAPTRVEIRIRNTRFGAEPQAIGRAARAMTNVMPASIETFVIIPVVKGIAASSITLRRSDIEALEHAPDGAWKSYVRARIANDDPETPESAYMEEAYPRFRWGLGPYASTSFFDPDEPVRVDFGAKLTASYEPSPGLILSTDIRKRIAGNRDDATRASNSVLPHVRSDGNLYAREGDPAIRHLTAAKYFRPGRELYGRVTLGYLERMFGGVSAELLWKPEGSRLAWGAEVNYAVQRDYDQLFGFRDYDVVTGHVSAYWDMGNGFHTQVDVGRYLAGDWGATLAVDREFNNGWRVGAYATLTDVPFEDFGEGSFDKGLRFTVPLEWFTGRPSATEFSTTIRSLARDGGARLNVDDRLYETVRDYQDPMLRERWGRFWR
jgi:hypothetical protein